MKHILGAVLLILSLQVKAQTATTPLDPALAIISERYVSPVGYDIPAWLERTRTRAARECGSDCPKEKSVAILTEAMAELGDPHAHVYETGSNSLPMQPAIITAGDTPVLLISDITGLGVADRAVHNAVHELNRRGATRVIIDLRGNSGGSPFATANAAGAFIQRTGWRLTDKDGQAWWGSFERGQIKYGSPKTDGKEETETFLDPAFFTGQVCVLVGPRTFSGGEAFALLFQRFKRAHIVGEPTGGGAGATANFFNLRLGVKLSLTTHLMYYEDGTRLPTRVTPDEIVLLDSEGVKKGRDNQIEACQVWLKAR